MITDHLIYLHSSKTKKFLTIKWCGYKIPSRWTWIALYVVAKFQWKTIVQNSCNISGTFSFHYIWFVKLEMTTKTLTNMKTQINFKCNELSRQLWRDEKYLLQSVSSYLVIPQRLFPMLKFILIEYERLWTLFKWRSVSNLISTKIQSNCIWFVVCNSFFNVYDVVWLVLG